MTGAPRLTRGRILDALGWIAEGRVPSPDGGRPADAHQLSAFAADALAPIRAGGCRWCGGAGCPACGIDRERETHSMVLALLREEGPMSGRALRSRIGGAPNAVVRSLHALEREGAVWRAGSGRYVVWHLGRGGGGGR